MAAAAALNLQPAKHTTIQSHHCTAQIIWHEGSAIDLLLLNSAMFVLVPGGCDRSDVSFPCEMDAKYSGQ